MTEVWDKAYRTGFEAARNANLENLTMPNAYVMPGASEGVTTDMARLKQRVELGILPDGTPLYKWVTGATLEEYTANLIKLFMAQNQPPTTTKIEAPRILFEEYANQWYDTFKAGKLQPTACLVYRSRLKKHIIPAFEGRYLDEITTHDIQKFMDSISHMAKASVRDITAILKQILDSAVEDEHIPKNPAASKRLHNPGVKTEPRKALDDEQVADIISNIPRLEKQNDRIFVAALMYTGLRRGEIYGLDWSDLDWENDLIHIERSVVFVSNRPLVKDTKTEAGERYVPFEPEFKRLLEPYRQDNGFIFARDRKNSGELYTEMVHKRAWARITKTINMHGMIPYEGRHTYLTSLDAEGVSPTSIQGIAGHANFTTTTKNYIHPKEAKIQAAGKIMHERFKRIGNAGTQLEHAKASGDLAR